MERGPSCIVDTRTMDAVGHLCTATQIDQRLQFLEIKTGEKEEIDFFSTFFNTWLIRGFDFDMMGALTEFLALNHFGNRRMF